jgi:hypothetical protein
MLWPSRVCCIPLHKSLVPSDLRPVCCVLVSQAGSHTPLQHIHAEYAEIRGRNEMQQARVEDILSQRLAVEQRTKQVGIRQHHAAVQ